MDSVVLSKPQTWQSCLGLCTICGTPMGLSPGARLKKDKPDDDVEDNIVTEERLKELVDQQQDGQLCENALKVALFKYNLLSTLQDCHVIDRYTMLPARGKGVRIPKDFEDILTDAHISVVKTRFAEKGMEADLFPAARGDVTATCEYDRAVQQCARVVEKRTVPGCKQCNDAMNRSVVHSDIVYRCFPWIAKEVDTAIETSREKGAAKAPTGMSAARANRVKKWVQQVCLYFNPPYDEGTRWTAKTDAELTLDASVYRCVINLFLWGKTGVARFRMIAVFYTAWFAYHEHGVRDRGISFVRWNLHVFRDAYMRQYTQPGTWLGMTQSEAATRFDLTRGDAGLWVGAVRSRMSAFGGVVAARDLDVPTLDKFWDLVHAHVTNEHTLLHFACHRVGVDAGLKTLLAYLMYNVDDPMCGLLRRRVLAFIAEAAHILRGERSKMKIRGAGGGGRAAKALALDDEGESELVAAMRSVRIGDKKG